MRVGGDVQGKAMRSKVSGVQLAFKSVPPNLVKLSKFVLNFCVYQNAIV